MEIQRSSRLSTLFENKVFNKATHLEQANQKIRLKRVFLVNSFIRNKLITSKIEMVEIPGI